MTINSNCWEELRTLRLLAIREKQQSERSLQLINIAPLMKQRLMIRFIHENHQLKASKLYKKTPEKVVFEHLLYFQNIWQTIKNRFHNRKLSQEIITQERQILQEYKNLSKMNTNNRDLKLTLQSFLIPKTRENLIYLRKISF